MAVFCQNCCNQIIDEKILTNKYITCQLCREQGKFNTSVEYGKLMNYEYCNYCSRQTVDPNRLWYIKQCARCYFFLKRQKRKEII